MNRANRLHNRGHYRSQRMLTDGFPSRTATNTGFVRNRCSFWTNTQPKFLPSLFRYCQSVTWTFVFCCFREFYGSLPRRIPDLVPAVAWSMYHTPIAPKVPQYSKHSRTLSLTLHSPVDIPPFSHPTTFTFRHTPQTVSWDNFTCVVNRVTTREMTDRLTIYHPSKTNIRGKLIYIYIYISLSLKYTD